MFSMWTNYVFTFTFPFPEVSVISKSGILSLYLRGEPRGEIRPDHFGRWGREPERGLPSPFRGIFCRELAAPGSRPLPLPRRPFPRFLFSSFSLPARPAAGPARAPGPGSGSRRRRAAERRAGRTEGCAPSGGASAQSPPERVLRRCLFTREKSLLAVSK